MNSRAVGASLASLLLLPLASCGSDDDKAGGDQPSVGDLESTLLTAADLPRGYRQAKDDDDDEDDDLGPFKGTCFAKVTKKLDALDGKNKDDDIEAERHFKLSGDSGQSTIDVTAAYSTDDVEAFKSQAKQAVAIMRSCKHITTTYQGVQIDLSLGGDQRVRVKGADAEFNFGLAGTMSAQGQRFPMGMSGVFAISGHTAAGVLTYAIGQQGITSRTVDLAAKQLDRLAQYR